MADDWFQADRLNSLVATLLFVILTLESIRRARSGRSLFIRRIPGLNALEEAIGRATEMNRKVLYVPGVGDLEDAQTVASVAILGHVARVTARAGADLNVVTRDILTYVAGRETVRAAYRLEGRPDQVHDGMVRYVTDDQYAFAAAVAAQMVRERPAANFLIGRFSSESLILAETGQSTGAIQIAGAADPTQLPFLVAACDYTLIGEELFAAGAYLSRDPALMGAIRAQDQFKLVAILVSLLGIVAASCGYVEAARLLQTH